MKAWAAIFDMDGVVADTNAFHQAAWRKFAQDLGRDLSEADLERNVYGRTNADITSFLLGPGVDVQRMNQVADAKEALFREWSKGRLAPVAGLPELLEALAAERVDLALATSAPPENASFVLAETGLARFFAVMVDSTSVARSKPAPDIFLAAARDLAVAPDRCLVFEDSLSGIEAGRAAGMTVVGVATTHSLAELAPHCALAVKDFQGLAPDSLAALLPDNA